MGARAKTYHVKTMKLHSPVLLETMRFIKGPTNNATGLKVVEHFPLLWGHLARAVLFDCPSSNEKIALSHPARGFSFPILSFFFFLR
jgi:hypothetical protein